MKHSESFELNLGCESSQIDFRTLSAVLTAIDSAMREIGKEFGIDHSVTLYAKPAQSGSYELPFEIIDIVATTLLADPELNQVRAMMDAFCKIINLKKLLAGEQPQEVKADGNNVIVQTPQGNTTIIDKRTFNIYENNTFVNSSIQHVAKAIDGDDSITELVVKDDKHKPLVTVGKHEFPALAEASPSLPDTPKTKLKSVRTKLNVFKLVFDADRKWEFFFNGNKIPAIIRDESFVGKIIEGERFANGDILDVDLQIEQHFDKTANTFINKKYWVEKVHEHIPRPTQKQLNLGEVSL